MRISRDPARRTPLVAPAQVRGDGRGFVGVGCTLLLLAAGCHSRPADTAAADLPDFKIPCKPAGAADFETVCTVDRATGPDGLVLTVHQPNGAFRRLLVTKDGRGVVAADGAETARVGMAGPGAIEVAIGGDRYRLPATVKPGPAPRP